MFSTSTAAAPARPLRIHDVTVVDVKTGALSEHRDIDIRYVGLAAIIWAGDRSARTIDVGNYAARLRRDRIFNSAAEERFGSVFAVSLISYF